MFLRLFSVLLLAGVWLAACSDEGQENHDPGAGVILTEWVVPYPDSRPRDAYAESAQKIWFVGQVGGYLAYFNPASEEFTKILLPEGSGPHNIIVDQSGNAWFSGNVKGYIGKAEPDGDFIAIPLPEDANDPHTLIDDGQGNIWFTAQGANVIGELNKTDFSKTLLKVPTPGARPYGITIAPDGRVWVALFGTGKLALVDPKLMAVTEISLPRTKARPRRLVADSHGMIWYVDYALGFLGRFDPDDQEFKEWPLPDGRDSGPYGMAIDAKDRIWFVETGPDPNKFIGFDPDSEEFFSVSEIESGGGAVRHMMYHQPTNTIWFGTDANTLVRAQLPD